MNTIKPTYYTRRPDDTYSVADPQPTIQPVNQELHPPHRCCECAECIEYFKDKSCDDYSGDTLLHKTVVEHIEDLRNASPILKENGLIETANEVLTAADELEAALNDKPVKQEPVAWRVHPFDYGVGHEGAYAMTMRLEQVEAWNRKGWIVESLYAAPVDAKAIRAEALDEAEEIAKTIGGSFSVEFLAAIRELK